MADCEDYQLPSLLPMDLDIEWDIEDRVDDLPHVFNAGTTVNNTTTMNSIAIDFKQLQSRSRSTSTPFGLRTQPAAKSFSCSNAPIKDHSNDSGFEIESSITASFAGQCTLSCRTSDNHGDESFTDSDAPMCVPSLVPQSDMELEQHFETDSAFGEGSSVCSIQSQALSDYHSVSSEFHRLDTVFQTLDPNLSECSLDLSPFIDQPCTTPPLGMSRTNSPTLPQSVPPIDIKLYLDNWAPVFSQSVLDRLIGRKMGLDHVDIIAELSSRNMDTCIKLIFTYVEAQDICRSCCVSRQWRNAITGCKSLVDRRARFLNSLTTSSLSKENQIAKSVEGGQYRSSRGLTEGKTEPLATLQMSQCSPENSVQESRLASKHEQFCHAASTLKNDESLRKCPRCQYPAKTHQVQERGQCTNPLCGFNFCIKCQSSFHGSRDCAMTVAPMAAKKSRTDAKVGSKKSKRNLRRL